MLIYVSLALLATAVIAEPQNYRTTPVPILKQINRHNDDGSYSYGYEGADGSFKIETKYPTGEVYGKYGYVDDTGKRREIEYGATNRGFEPSGTDVNVPPPTLINGAQDNSLDYDDGQYREDPAVYNKYKKRPLSSGQQSFNTDFTYKTRTPAVPQYNPAPAPAPAPVQSQHYTNSDFTYRTQTPAFSPQRNYYQPAPQPYNPQQFAGHPAANVDINTGSYTLSYTG